MSMITEQIERLKKYAQILEDTSTNRVNADLMCVNAMREAADTIEELSAKLHAVNMERSSQYYYGGWIPCDERMPEERKSVLVYCPCGNNIYCAYLENGQWLLFGAYTNQIIEDVIE